MVNPIIRNLIATLLVQQKRSDTCPFSLIRVETSMTVTDTKLCDEYKREVIRIRKNCFLLVPGHRSRLALGAVESIGAQT